MANWTNTTKGGVVSISIGNPIGLLLTLTHAAAVSSDTSWTNTTRNTATFTNVNKS